MQPLEKESSYIKTTTPAADYDPIYIKFSYLSMHLHFEGIHPAEIWKKQNTVLLNNCYLEPGFLEGVTNTSISLQNNCRSPVLNFHIYSKESGKTIFTLHEFPDKKSLRLEFKKAGTYEFHFFIAGSPFLSQITFKVLPSLSKKTSIKENFKWDLKPPW